MTTTPPSLRRKALSGVTWTAVDALGNHGVQLVVSLLIARMLDPSDYGLIAMVMVVIEVFSVFIDGGLSRAIVQRQNISQRQLATIFYFNLAMSCGLYLLLCAAAPWIALAFDLPQLAGVLRVAGLGMIVGALSSVQLALLVKELQFRREAAVNATSLVVSSATGLAMAWHGWGVWALVAMSLARRGSQVLLLWCFSTWRPLIHFAWSELQNLWEFSSKLLAASVLDVLFRNLQVLLIARCYSATDLGFYAQGRRIPDTIATNATSVLQRVSFPLLSTIQSDDQRLVAAYRRMLTTAASVIFPAALLVAACAPALIEVLLTAKWLPAAAYMQVLACAAALYPIHALNLNIAMVKGRSDIFLRLAVLKKLFGVALMLLAAPLGVLALAYSTLANSLIALYLNTKFNGDLIQYPWRAQLRDLLPPFVAAALAAGGAKGVGMAAVETPMLRLTLQLAVGVAVYVGTAAVLRLDALRELRAVIAAYARRSSLC